MFKPTFKLVKDDFPPDKFMCLGSQLITIVNFLQEILEPHVWYAADIESNDVSYDPNLDRFLLKKIGGDSSLIVLATEIEQFVCGVFIAVDEKYEDQDIQHISLGTDEDQFRPIEMEGIFLEIRTFDTGFFLIFSEDENLMRKLGKKLDLDEIEFSYPDE